MTDYIVSILTATDDLYDEENPRPYASVLMTEYNDRRAYLYTGDSPDWPDSYIVGAWPETGLQLGQSWDDSDPPEVIGTPTYPVHADYTEFIRPLGNADRRATGDLDSLRWQGRPEEKYIQDAERYTDSDDPFVLTITRDYSGIYPDWVSITTYPQGEKVMWEGQGYQSQQTNNIGREPGAPGSGPWWAQTEFGYGWIATMIEPAVSQDPVTNYNIRVYPTEECVPGEQIYTSGNFADVGDVFQTSATSNNWTATEEQVNIALIFVGGGNTQNGIITMDVGVDEVTAQFWSHDQ